MVIQMIYIYATLELSNTIQIIHTACKREIVDTPIKQFIGYTGGREYPQWSYLWSHPDAKTAQGIRMTIGDDLAGYYSMWKPEEDPQSICVALTRFARTGEAWKVQPWGGMCSFEPQAGQDVKALAMERVESDPVLELTPRGADVEEPPFDLDVSIVLECFAYDCQLEMTVNGVKLAYGGGSSYGQRLFGAAEGVPPAEPGLLKVGPNRIDVKYRRTAEGSPLTVELYIQPAGRCLRMVGGKPAGEMSATFTIARKPTEQLTADEIDCVEVVDQ